MSDNTPTSNSAPTLEDLRAHRGEIMDLATRYGVSNIRLIGDVARADATPESPVMFYVDLEEGRGLDIFTFANEVDDLIGHPVKIGNRIPEQAKDQVLADLVEF